MSVTADGPDEPPPRDVEIPTWRSHWVGVTVVGVCALTPLFAYFSNLGFAPLVGLAGLACLPLMFRPRRLDPRLAVLFVLTVWAMVSMLWSVATPLHPDFSHHRAGRDLTALKLPIELALYGAFVVAAGLLSARGAARALAVLAVGLAILAVVFMLDALFKAPLYNAVRNLAHQTARPDLALRDMSRAAYVMALLFWPAATRFERPALRIVAAGLAVAMLVGSYVLGADAPFAALGVATAVYFAVRLLGRPAVLILLAGVVVYFLAAPVLIAVVDKGQMLHPPANDLRIESWAIRLDIWRFTAARIHERPFWGWGLDAARTFSPNIPLHTHDAAMQIWLELGAVGACLAALFWSWVVVQIDRLESLDRPAAAAVAAAASAYLTIGALSFGVWQEWWLALGALTAAVCIALVKSRARGTVAA